MFYIANVFIPGTIALFHSSVVIWIAWTSNPSNWLFVLLMLIASTILWFMAVTGWRKSKAHAENGAKCRRLMWIKHRLRELDSYGPASEEVHELAAEFNQLMREVLAFAGI